MKYILLIVFSFIGYFMYLSYNPNSPLAGNWKCDFENEEWYVNSKGSVLVRRNNTFYATQDMNILNVFSISLYSEGTWTIKGGELKIVIEKSNVPFVNLPQEKSSDFMELSNSRFVIEAQGRQYSHSKVN